MGTFDFRSMSPEQLAEIDAEARRREQVIEDARRAARIRQAGIPDRYKGLTLDDYKTETEPQKKALAAARRFLEDPDEFKTLVLLGPAGTGKTHLACTILNEYGWGLYRTAPGIVEDFRRAKSFNAAETEADLLYSYVDKILLIVDEIGRAINATDEKYALYQVINELYNARCRSVLISNFSKADFFEYIGVAAADRLVESAEIVELSGASYRRELRGAK